MRTRTVARRAADRLLERVGVRLVSSAEQRVAEARYRSVVTQLHAALGPRFTPPLVETSGQVQLLCQLRGTEVTEALHLLHLLQQTLQGPGDVCELGVAQGATSALLANEIRHGGRNLWLYDSFRGLSVPTGGDALTDDIFGLGAMDRYAGTMAHSVDEVLARLRSVDFPVGRTRVVPGFIRPDLPPDQLPDVVAFAYLDFDLYEPILVGLRLLHGRCRPGSVLMVDDYGYFSSGPQLAVKEFLADHAEQYALLDAPPGAGHFCSLRRL